MNNATVEQQEYMSLAPGVGIVPEKYRNRGYGKLGIEPGEGGIGRLLEDRANRADAALTKADFLSGIRELVTGLTAAGPTKTKEN